MDAATSAEILHRFEKLNVWRRGDQRAPHKPLLVLLALGLFLRNIRIVPFAEYGDTLSDLLREFGPQRQTYYPELPFLHLRSDRVWQVAIHGELVLRFNLSKKQLRELNATGRFTDDVQRLFDEDPRTIATVARLLLDRNFPESVHRDILDATGLSLDISTPAAQRRDPLFRGAVLTAYEYRCALCNLDVRIGNMSVGLEAAHIKWHQAHGPDVVANGIALCCMHHKLFDLGAFTLGDGRRVLVSDAAYGSTRQFEEILLRHHGHQLNAPVHAEDHPSGDFIDWHRAQVFKGRARPV
ncbi:hypothetical protein AWB75_00177 [Caballeronia catudaia]|uniref:Uncharacterized protein n=1 Tax=Caballeronia catudaia TaxID=1777136 RepID=A0A157Z3Y6_9BURK|nr:HNH endonuclease [Caballeronia catudaia]SAK40244.1 hypothetical protein AWB75_00177 [Caballeronia catudaia]